jgi:hypothetical protein
LADFAKKYFVRVETGSGEKHTVTAFGNSPEEVKINGQRIAERLLREKVVVLWVKPYN